MRFHPQEMHRTEQGFACYLDNVYVLESQILTGNTLKKKEKKEKSKRTEQLGSLMIPCRSCCRRTSSREPICAPRKRRLQRQKPETRKMQWPDSIRAARRRSGRRRPRGIFLFRCGKRLMPPRKKSRCRPAVADYHCCTRK